MPCVRLERDQPSAGRQCPRHPDRAVAAERADFEDRPRLGELGEQRQQLALRSRDRDRRQARGVARRERAVERRVARSEQIGDVAVDGVPLLPAHERSLAVRREDGAAGAGSRLALKAVRQMPMVKVAPERAIDRLTCPHHH